MRKCENESIRQPPRPLVLGHRGSAGLAPENTLAGIRAAARAGADGIEFDVQLSRDGVPVLIHDETLDRTTDGRGPVAARTRSELKRLDAGVWFGPGFRRERIPTLEEALRLAKRLGLRCYVELKNNRVSYPGLERKALARLRRTGMLRRSWVASFNLASVERVRRLAPRQAVLWITPRAPGPALIRRLRRTGIGGVSILHLAATPDVAGRLRAAGLALQMWTVNRPPEILRALRFRPEAIVSDRPDRAVRLRDGILGKTGTQRTTRTKETSD